MTTRQLTGIVCAALVLLNPSARVMVQADTEAVGRGHPQGAVAATVLQRLRLPGVLVRPRHRRRWWSTPTRLA